MPYHRNAFTLIELVIAIALGMLVVLIAFAGFRVAAATVQQANRLATENSLIRFGLGCAMEDVDFWLGWDDPDRPVDGQRLRRSATAGSVGCDDPSAGTLGLPFAPMAAVFPRSVASYTPDPIAGAAEADRGWDPDYHWPAADARTWFHGQTMIHTSLNRTLATSYGCYSLFTNRYDQVTARAGLAASGTAPAVWNNYGSGLVPLRTWRDNQVYGVMQALGFYGMFDYLPANTVFWALGRDPDTTGDSSDQPPRLFTSWVDWANPAEFRLIPFEATLGIGTGTAPLTRIALMDNGSFQITPAGPGSAAAGWTTAQMITQNFNHIQVGSRGELQPAKQLYYQGLDQLPLLTTHPSTWMDLRLQVFRGALRSRLGAVVGLTWFDPQTGREQGLTLDVPGTTLRGARQQRTPDGRWARWDDVPRGTTGPSHLPWHADGFSPAWYLRTNATATSFTDPGYDASAYRTLDQP